jgi:MFS transporter, OFA family, oxalate/formate antiporter
VNSSEYITIQFSRGWVVTFAAVGIGLVLGILYVWSVIKGGIPAAWGWTNAEKALPFSVMTASLAVMMVPAGRLQDRIGPRKIVMLGGFLAGLGCIVSGLGQGSLFGYVVGFGVLTGSGAGIGNSALTPAAIKWFPPQRTGFITGLVVGGTGMAPVFLAPLSFWLLRFFQNTSSTGVVEEGISQTMIVLGLVVWAVIGVLSRFITNPPLDSASMRGHFSSTGAIPVTISWRSMMRTGPFWALYFMYFCGAAAGLTFISVAQDLGKQALGELAFTAVAVLAAGNTLGRILAGWVSDRIGREMTLFTAFVCQGLVVAGLYWTSTHGGGGWAAILIIAFFLGLNYGSNLSLFPAACKDRFGLSNFGLNYGCLFSSFGLAGLVMPWLNGLIKDRTGDFRLSCSLIAAMLAASAVLALVMRRTRRTSGRTE